MDKTLSVRAIFPKILLLIILVKCVFSEETMDFIREQRKHYIPYLYQNNSYPLISL